MLVETGSTHRLLHASRPGLLDTLSHRIAAGTVTLDTYDVKRYDDIVVSRPGWPRCSWRENGAGAFGLDAHACRRVECEVSLSRSSSQRSSAPGPYCWLRPRFLMSPHSIFKIAVSSRPER